MKPLDFVRTPKGAIAMVVEVNEVDGRTDASISYIGGGNPTKEKNAWWREDELQVIDNFPQLVSREMAHPMGKGKEYAEKAFPTKAA